jgi:uncharacterized protein YigA (DUF484 family)
MNHEPPPPTDIPDLQRALHHPNPNTRRAVSSAIDELIRLRAEVADLKARLDTAWGDNGVNDRITDRLRAEIRRVLEAKEAQR